MSSTLLLSLTWWLMPFVHMYKMCWHFNRAHLNGVVRAVLSCEPLVCSTDVHQLQSNISLLVTAEVKLTWCCIENRKPHVKLLTHIHIQIWNGHDRGIALIAQHILAYIRNTAYAPLPFFCLLWACLLPSHCWSPWASGSAFLETKVSMTNISQSHFTMWN